MQHMGLDIDPLSRILSRIVWRMNIEELLQIEALATTDPMTRIMGLMSLVTRSAQRDGEIRQMLSKPGVLEGLKKMVLDRKPVQEQQEMAESVQP